MAPDLARSLVLVLVLAHALGCRGEVGPGSGESGPGTTGGAQEPGATIEGTTVDGTAPATGTSTDTGRTTDTGHTTDTGRTTDTGMGTTAPVTTEGTSGSSSEGTSSSSSEGTSSSSSEGTSSSSEGTSSSSEGSTTDTGEVSECAFSESFDGLPDGSDWPAPWIPLEGVMLADVQAGRGRLLPVTGPYALARMFVPLPLECVDVEGTFTFELTDDETPGVGLYLRHNGGFLDQTDPPGQGYVAFVQAFGLGTGIGLWRELEGVETILAPFTPQAITTGVVHAVRFRVTQEDAATTRLQTRMWPLEGLEPAVWHVDLTDGTPSLQGVGGGLVIDVWTQLEVGVAADVYVDDIVVGPA